MIRGPGTVWQLESRLSLCYLVVKCRFVTEATCLAGRGSSLEHVG
jgi:hypothetical protein